MSGYPNGTFRPNSNMTRAEVTTIVNRMLGRSADEDFVDSHADELRQFTDLNDSHWGYYNIMEAANAHDFTWVTVGGDKVEKWTGMLEDRDWAALERAWSEANDAPGGEVID